MRDSTELVADDEALATGILGRLLHKVYIINVNLRCIYSTCYVFKVFYYKIKFNRAFKILLIIGLLFERMGQIFPEQIFREHGIINFAEALVRQCAQAAAHGIAHEQCAGEHGRRRRRAEHNR